MLNRSAQLPHIAMPRATLHFDHGLGNQHGGAGAELRGKMLGQPRNIRRPLAQRGQRNLKRAKPHQEVVAKFTSLDELAKIKARR